MPSQPTHSHKIQFITRQMANAINEANEYFPVITLTGPRQSGKSTLYRHLFHHLPYFSLEDPDTRLAVKSDPKGFLLAHKEGVILDEVQNYPEILSYIQTIVDLNPQAKFYLTGSSNFSLLKVVSQSLAGRTAVFELLPLALEEIRNLENNDDIDDLLYDGFYPAIWSGKNKPSLLYPSYVKTYLQRDVRDLIGVRELDVFQRFIRLCAARIGSVFNATELSNELGVAVNTVKSWLSVLQASYIVYLLPPFHTNTGKRLTKSPKIYFTDTGLAAYLLDIESPGIMARDKMRGHLFENMVVMEFLKRIYNQGKSSPLYFYRDSNGVEVDLMMKKGSVYDCYEIKSSQTFHPDFTKGLKSFGKAFPDLTGKQYVIYAGTSLGTLNHVDILNYRDM